MRFMIYHSNNTGIGTISCRLLCQRSRCTSISIKSIYATIGIEGYNVRIHPGSQFHEVSRCRRQQLRCSYLKVPIRSAQLDSIESSGEYRDLLHHWKTQYRAKYAYQERITVWSPSDIQHYCSIRVAPAGLLVPSLKMLDCC